MHGHMNVKLIL